MVSRVHPLTARQADLLRFIAGYQLAHDGISPSHAEMAKALGFKSRSASVRLIECLEERGHVSRLRDRARAIQILTPVSIPYAHDGAPLYAVRLPEFPA